MSKARTETKTKKPARAKLPVILGIRPIVYLPLVYTIILLILLYQLLIGPGVKKNGTLYLIESSPAAAEVFVDGVWKGSTPCTVFIPKGDRQLELKKNGFAGIKDQQKVQGRILLTRFFPKRDQVHYSFIPEDFPSLLEGRMREHAGWGLSGIPQGNSFIPPLWTQTANDFYRWGSPLTDKNPSSEVQDVQYEKSITASLPFVTNRILLSDAVRGYLVFSGKGAVLTPQSLLKLISKADNLLAHGGTGPVYWLNGILSETEDLPLNTAWVDYYQKIYAQNDSVAEVDTTPVRAGEMRFGDVLFISLTGGVLRTGDPYQQLPEREPETDALLKEDLIPSFMIMDREINNSEFGRFLEENNQWGAEQSAVLQAKGLIDEGYLVDYPGADNEPITGISWFAAEAFCNWFTDEYLSGTGYRAVLPSEQEREYSDSLLKTKGRVWEWCRGGYAPIASAFPSENYWWSPAAAVRGGCVLNEAGSIKPWTRAAQPRTLCSPWTGFRMVLIRNP